MVSEEGLRKGASAVARSQDELASYIARHPNLPEDFILVARQDGAEDVRIITVGDIVGDGSKGTTSDRSEP
jgi:hypothetical protein